MRIPGVTIDLDAYPVMLVAELARAVRELGSWPEGVRAWLDEYALEESEVAPECPPEACDLERTNDVAAVCERCRLHALTRGRRDLTARLLAELADLGHWRAALGDAEPTSAGVGPRSRRGVGAPSPGRPLADRR